MILFFEIPGILFVLAFLFILGTGSAISRGMIVLGLSVKAIMFIVHSIVLLIGTMRCKERKFLGFLIASVNFGIGIYHTNFFGSIWYLMGESYTGVGFGMIGEMLGVTIIGGTAMGIYLIAEIFNIYVGLGLKKQSEGDRAMLIIVQVVLILVLILIIYWLMFDGEPSLEEFYDMLFARNLFVLVLCQ